MITPKLLAQTALRRFGVAIVRAHEPEREFWTSTYLRHNARRLEHLASLQLPLRGRSVLEVGAGIGDHSHFYLDRGCTVTITEARQSNLEYLRKRYNGHDVRHLDLEHPGDLPSRTYEVIHCYGLLYHLRDPLVALQFLSGYCGDLLLLETCVSFGSGKEINPVAENLADPTQAVSGIGCRPTRPWLFETLKSLFEYVYVPRVQPSHEEFPVDWTARPQQGGALSRSVFIASRTPIQNALLTTELLMRQERH
jgi:hypothetical protein